MPTKREILLAELRQIEGSYSESITPEKQKRARLIIRELNKCKCRNCGKIYDQLKSRAYYKGFCSAKCLHTKSKSLGYKKGKQKFEFDVLKAHKEIGSVFVIQ